MEDYVIIEGNIKYILSSCPNEKNIEEYSTFLKNNNVKYLVNFCEKEYQNINRNISVKYESLFIEDGKIPELDKLERWKELCMECIKENKNIALHCVSGMGRAPTMLCISLIEYDNYNSLEAIELLREKRKGCLNSKQLHYLLNYKKNKVKIGCIIL